jgi:hypothetical protein
MDEAADLGPRSAFADSPTRVSPHASSLQSPLLELLELLELLFPLLLFAITGRAPRLQGELGRHEL